MYLKYIQCAKTCKNMQKHAKTCKNVQKRASQVLINQKTCISSSHLPKNVQNVQKRAKTCISSTYLPINVHLKVSFTKKRAKTCKKRAKTCKTCKNVHLKCFWILFKNVHCQGPCILRPCISRPYCMQIRI